MEQIKALLDRVPIYGVALFVLAIFSWDYYDFLNSDSSSFAAQKSKVQDADNQLKVFKKKRREMEEFGVRLEQRRFEMNEVLNKLSSMKASIPENIDLASMIQAVHTEATRTGIVIESIRPGAVSEKETYGEQDFTMTFKGVYIQLLVFTEKLSNFQRILTIESLSVAPSGQINSGNVEIRGTLVMKTYRYKQSSADDIIKKSAPVSIPVPVAAPISVPVTAPTGALPPAAGGR